MLSSFFLLLSGLMLGLGVLAIPLLKKCATWRSNLKALRWMEDHHKTISPRRTSPGPWWDWKYPTIVIEYDRGPITIKFLNGTKEVDLAIRCHWPAESGFRANLVPEHPVDDLRKRFSGLQDIQVGDEVFDSKFLIQSPQPEELLQRGLTEEVRSLILGLRIDLKQLTIAGGEFLVSGRTQVSGFHLNRLVKDVAKIRREMIAAILGSACLFEYEQGIVPLNDVEFSVVRETASMQSHSDAICLVCGTGVDESYVQCNRCFTLHHQECWDYLGHCSVFACGSRQSSARS